MAHSSLSMYFIVYCLLHCQTIVQILHTVNNVEVTVNTCTCTNVFTVITTKDQLGRITVMLLHSGSFSDWLLSSRGVLIISTKALMSG